MIQKIIEWIYFGKGQILLGFMLFAAGCFLLVAGAIFVISGLNGGIKEIITEP